MSSSITLGRMSTSRTTIKAPVWIAAREGNGDCLRLLIQAGAYVRDNEGQTPVFIAAYLGRDGCILQLIQAGANVNTFDKYKRTPLQVTMDDNEEYPPKPDRYNHKSTYRLLIQAGAKILWKGKKKSWLL